MSFRYLNRKLNSLKVRSIELPLNFQYNINIFFHVISKFTYYDIHKRIAVQNQNCENCTK